MAVMEEEIRVEDDITDGITTTRVEELTTPWVGVTTVAVLAAAASTSRHFCGIGSGEAMVPTMS